MIKIGIVGAGGYWGSKWIDLFNREDCKVKWICDSDRRKTAVLSKKYLAFNNLDHINREFVDGVYIATPAETHFEVAKRCLEAGKDILVEKPLTTSTAQALELVELAKRNNCLLMVSHTFIYNEAIRTVSRLVKRGVIGVPQYVYSRRTNFGPTIMDVNILWDVGPHELSILLKLMGEKPNRIAVHGGDFLKSGLADLAFMCVGFPSNHLGHTHLSWLDFYKMRTITVVGSEGMVGCYDYAGRENAVIQVQKFARKDKKLSRGKSTKYRVDVSRTLENEVEEFIGCLHTGEKPLTDGEAGLEVVRLLELAEKSLNNGGTIVEF